MVFNADACGAALVAVVVGDAVVGSVVDEQPAIITATHAASPTHCARETIIATASVGSRTLARSHQARRVFERFSSAAEAVPRSTGGAVTPSHEPPTR